jgi:hypothetical protein
MPRSAAGPARPALEGPTPRPQCWGPGRFDLRSNGGANRDRTGDLLLAKWAVRVAGGRHMASMAVPTGLRAVAAPAGGGCFPCVLRPYFVPGEPSRRRASRRLKREHCVNSPGPSAHDADAHRQCGSSRATGPRGHRVARAVAAPSPASNGPRAITTRDRGAPTTVLNIPRAATWPR